MRHGQIIGRITAWGRNISIKCWMHPKAHGVKACGHAVRDNVPILSCVEWLAKGTPNPLDASDEVKRLNLENHKSLPRPSPQ